MLMKDYESIDYLPVRGLSASRWYELFCATYSRTNIGFIFNAWPDGGTYFDQDNTMLEVFSVIEDEFIKDIKRRKSSGIAGRNYGKRQHS